MDFNLTPEQQLMRDAVRRLVAREIDPLLSKHDANQALPKAAFLAIFALQVPFPLIVLAAESP